MNQNEFLFNKQINSEPKEFWPDLVMIQLKYGSFMHFITLLLKFTCKKISSNGRSSSFGSRVLFLHKAPKLLWKWNDMTCFLIRKVNPAWFDWIVFYSTITLYDRRWWSNNFPSGHVWKPAFHCIRTLFLIGPAYGTDSVPNISRHPTVAFSMV